MVVLIVNKILPIVIAGYGTKWKVLNLLNFRLVLLHITSFYSCDTLNESQVDANMGYWQGMSGFNSVKFGDYSIGYHRFL